MNATSSKSSIIVTVFVEKKVTYEHKIGTRVSKITFIDMVGERNLKHSGVTGNAEKEEIECNQCVRAFENVLRILSQKQNVAKMANKIVPYRDS